MYTITLYPTNSSYPLCGGGGHLHIQVLGLGSRQTCLPEHGCRRSAELPGEQQLTLELQVGGTVLRTAVPLKDSLWGGDNRKDRIERQRGKYQPTTCFQISADCFCGSFPPSPPQSQPPDRSEDSSSGSRRPASVGAWAVERTPYVAHVSVYPGASSDGFLKKGTWQVSFPSLTRSLNALRCA